MFRTDLLSIIMSLNTVFTAIGIFHTNYVAYMLARSGWNLVYLSETCRDLDRINLRNSASLWLLLEEYITMYGPLNVKNEFANF